MKVYMLPLHLIALSVLLMLSGCGNRHSTINAEYKPEKELIEFLQAFEKAAKKADKVELMSQMNPEYLEVQHKGLHQGDTDRFLDELICGSRTDGGGFKCPGIENIVSIRHIEIRPKDGGYQVLFLVQTSEYAIQAELHITVAYDDEETFYAIYGGVG